MFDDEYVPDIPALSGVDRSRVTVDGHPIHYLHAGEGRPIVLLHGGIIDAAHVSWAPQLAPLADEGRLIVPNLPGYGPNPLPDVPLSIPWHARTVAGVLEALDLQDALVAGISLGGGVAVGLGLDYPERITALVAVDAMGLGRSLAGGTLTWLLARLQVTNHLSVGLMRRSRRYVEIGLEALVADSYDVPGELIELVQQESRRPGAGAAFRSLRGTEVTRNGYRTEYTDRLPTLSVPTRFVHGVDDEVFPLAWSERAAERAPEASPKILPDCGHLATWERPDAIADVVVDCL
jgi:pimeloyl-ACP methyl ester carboxylesterase